MKSFDHMVLEWARKQPADGEYSYCNPYGCALARFLMDTGICANPGVGGTDWVDASLPRSEWIRHELSPALADALEEGERTFGALADRLSTALLEKVG